MKDNKLIELPLTIPHLRFAPALAICLLLTASLGYLDIITGPEFAFSIFYLLPVTLALLMNGRRLGFLISVFSAAVWLFADIDAGATYSSKFIPFWNALMRLGFFSLHCYLIGLLTDMVKTVKDLSLHDPLTQAANWRFFEEYSNKVISSAIREKQAVTLAFMDLDNFKALNDRLGHSAGDEALVLLAQTIRAGIRPNDMLARMGGDEFLLLLAGPDFIGADEVLKRLHAAVSREMEAKGWELTVSVGAVTFSSLSSPVGALIAQADDLMYAVKNSGKNALRHAEWP